ncbi:hypothetical protein CEE45_11135 [Candidatus Heimdallarchaeota archaeon B3_Heim]|nr:MAG: hypothetical protein CEE45_11135 [Candidatus Heimdallarchaeota archaeon B3_Heim]
MDSLETDIFICDKSWIMKNLWSWIEKKCERENTARSEKKFVEYSSDILSATSICRKIQELKYIHAKRCDIVYNQVKIKSTKFYEISKNRKIFLNENKRNSFNRLNAAIIQDSEVRNEITRITKEIDDFTQLDLSVKVESEDRWARVTSGDSPLIDKPDIITYQFEDAKKGKARELIQNKLIRELGHQKGKISSRDYLLDFCKTIGHYSTKDGTGLIKLQLELLERGETLGGKIPFAKRNHAVIISYWGVSFPMMQRLGDVIASVILRKYSDSIQNESCLIDEVSKNLSLGKKALNGRQLESISKSTIKSIIGDTKMGETTYLKNRFLSFLEQYISELRNEN